MEHPQKDNLVTDNKDVDFSSVLTFTYRIAKKIAGWMSDFFWYVMDGFLFTIFFFKKNFIWLCLAIVAGSCFGFYKKKNSHRSFESVMTARFNYGSTRNLYSILDYFNHLLAEGQGKEVGKMLSIPEQDVMSVQHFSAVPVQDETEVYELYAANFLLGDRSTGFRSDSFWMANVSIDSFKKNLTKYDFPLQAIKIVSTSPYIFEKIQSGFISFINSQDILKNSQQIIKQMHLEEERILTSSLRSLDSLKLVYYQGLQSATTTINIFDNKVLKHLSGVGIYEEVLRYRDELKAYRKKLLKEGEMVQVVTSFDPIGKSIESSVSIISYVFYSLAFVLTILIIIELYPLLKSFEAGLKNSLSHPDK